MNAKEKAIEICNRDNQETAKILIESGLVKVRYNPKAKNGLEVSISVKGRNALKLLGSLPQ